MTFDESARVRIPVRTIGRAREGGSGGADPTTLGLLAYGMPTVLYGLSNAKAFELGSAVLGMAVVFGGLAQLVVAVLAARAGDAFKVTLFGGFAAFWLTFAVLLVGDSPGEHSAADSPAAMGWYLALWAVFALGMTVASTPGCRALTWVLGFTVLLLAVLAVGFWSGAGLITTLGGWAGIGTGVAAMYTGFGFLINDSLGRALLPVGGPHLPSRSA